MRGIREGGEAIEMLREKSGITGERERNEGRGMRGKREEGQGKRDVRGRDEREEVRRMNEMDDWLRIICRCEK